MNADYDVFLTCGFAVDKFFGRKTCKLKYKGPMRHTLIFRLAYFWAMFILAVSGLSCAGLPVQEMSDARQAIASAKEVSAPQLASDEFEKARKLMHLAEEDLDIGNYQQAQKNAVAAKKNALLARDKAIQIKQQQE